jgi:hypothetical protein
MHKFSLTLNIVFCCAFKKARISQKTSTKITPLSHLFFFISFCHEHSFQNYVFIFPVQQHEKQRRETPTNATILLYEGKINWEQQGEDEKTKGK